MTVRSESSSSMNDAISTSFSSTSSSFNRRYFFSFASSEDAPCQMSHFHHSAFFFSPIIQLFSLSILLIFSTRLWKQRHLQPPHFPCAGPQAPVQLNSAIHITDRPCRAYCHQFRVCVCFHRMTSTFHYVFTSFLCAFHYKKILPNWQPVTQFFVKKMKKPLLFTPCANGN